MKPLIFLSFLLAFAVPCAAQIVSGPPAVVPAGTWPYVADETLEKAGIALGYPEGTWTRSRVMTRYQFAVAVVRLLAQMPEKDAANPQTDIGKRLQQSPLAVNALLALMDDFNPELEKLKQNVKNAQSLSQILREAQNLLFTLRDQQRQDIYTRKIELTPEQLQSPFAELSNRDLSWHNTDTLGRSGIIVGASEGTGDLLPVTRLQMAISIARLVSQLPQSSELMNRLLHNSNELPALHSLIAEFSPELKLLGDNPDSYVTQLAKLERIAPMPLAARSASGPFTDAGTITNKAFQNVDILQRAGIVMGDPGDLDAFGNGRSHLSRVEYATAVARLMEQVVPHPTTALMTFYGVRTDWNVDLEHSLLVSPAAIVALKSLVDEFTPELVLLQQNVAADRAWLASLAETIDFPLAEKPFADVPHSHWAASAVETLRLRGLVAGYGNGNFSVTQ